MEFNVKKYKVLIQCGKIAVYSHGAIGNIAFKRFLDRFQCTRMDFFELIRCALGW